MAKQETWVPWEGPDARHHQARPAPDDQAHPALAVLRSLRAGSAQERRESQGAKGGMRGGGVMLALCVTCRPAWQPWLLHQLAKQEHDYQLIVFDDCSTPLTWPERTVVVRRENRLRMTLGEKRQAVLCLAEPLNEPFAWFDDDDWHPKERLYMGSVMLNPTNTVGSIPHELPWPTVVGYHAGIFVDVKTLQTRRLETGDSVTFNGAVFAPHCAKHRFDPMNRGEDTMWLRKVLKESTVVSSPVMQHAWISGDWNVTGRRGSMSFEGRRFDRFDSWEIDFLKKVAK